MKKERLHLLLIFACMLFTFGSCFGSLIALITIRDFHGIQKERMDSLEFKMLQERVNNLEPLLPHPFKLSTEFSEESRKLVNMTEREKTTIRNKLIELCAYSKDGKIYDRSGKEIYFHWMYEVGATHKGSGKIKEDEEKLLKKLEQTHNVLKMWPTRIPQ